MVSREGMEMGLFLGAVLFQVRSLEVLVGACAGVTSAGLIALLWARYGPRVNLTRFLQATALFLALFVPES